MSPRTIIGRTIRRRVIAEADGDGGWLVVLPEGVVLFGTDRPAVVAIAKRDAAALAKADPTAVILTELEWREVAP